MTNPSDIQAMVERLREGADAVEPNAEHAPEPLSADALALVDSAREAADTLERLSLPVGEDAVDWDDLIYDLLIELLEIQGDSMAAHNVRLNKPDDTARAMAKAIRAALSALPAPVHAVPLDNASRPFSDSLLPAAMIEAGEDVLDQVAEDGRNYVSGVTTDWDNGMVAVAVYRAMTKAALTSSPAPAQEGVTEAPIYEARLCPDMPVDCVNYGVISHETGKEVCRVWDEVDALLIADLPNRSRHRQATAIAERLPAFIDECERLRKALEHIELRSTNHGGWFDQDHFGEYCKLGDIARAALSQQEKG